MFLRLLDFTTIEHSLNYKYEGRIPKEIKDRLQRAAEAAYLLDEEMSKIRGEPTVRKTRLLIDAISVSWMAARDG